MKTYKSIILLFTALLLVSGNSIQAQEQSNFSEKEIENLLAGINSDNNGLMRSSVYFAGKYQIPETVDALTNKLEEEVDPSNVILIALAIYKIGDRDALMKVLETAKQSENMKVKRMLNAIVVEHLVETETGFVLR